MRLLTNPLVLRMAVVLIAAAVAFAIAFIIIRQLRRSVQDEASFGEGKPSNESFTLDTYHAVIQQLKQQKHELQTLQQAEKRRADATQNISAAVLSNLSSGVLVFNSSGLVRQANAAAKNILGIASPGGMNSAELFRSATVRGGLNSERTPLTEAVATSLKNLSKFHRLDADYTTPGGEQRLLEITISPLYGANAELLGAACLINDQTEVSRIRESPELGSATSELSSVQDSVASISKYAKALIAMEDLTGARNLAREIAAEADHLQAMLGGTSPKEKTIATALGKN
jgi:nitrogen fixation/metabolism regulation signal transduction histidine kinase